jgi:hypothetical protein
VDRGDATSVAALDGTGDVLDGGQIGEIESLAFHAGVEVLWTAGDAVTVAVLAGVEEGGALPEVGVRRGRLMGIRGVVTTGPDEQIGIRQGTTMGREKRTGIRGI